jgi:hypothetical protein
MCWEQSPFDKNDCNFPWRRQPRRIRKVTTVSSFATNRVREPTKDRRQRPALPLRKNPEETRFGLTSSFRNGRTHRGRFVSKRSARRSIRPRYRSALFLFRGKVGGASPCFGVVPSRSLLSSRWSGDQQGQLCRAELSAPDRTTSVVRAFSIRAPGLPQVRLAINKYPPRSNRCKDFPQKTDTTS